MNIQIKRIYEAVSPADGKRILVDRLWPRGVSKAQAQLDLWPKELTPSDALRQWYHEDIEQRWDEFQQRYQAELAGQQEALQQLRDLARQDKITLLTAAKNAGKNHAEVLKRILQSGFPRRPAVK
ncbi:MAG: DUF488 family protein [Acinetobacter sp.]|nr:DUF488 family protein [Acinetobacter sp.]